MEKLIRKNSSMGNLPMDVLTNIFLRVPVKSLLSLKSVCKSWHSLITSRFFANLHLRQSYLPCERLLVFVGEDHSLYAASLDSGGSHAIKLPLRSTWERFSRKNIIGTCNGLLLCMGDENSEFEALLINPSTLNRKRVPKLQVPQSCLYLNYGFGYDCSVDDYKIVRIAHFLGSHIYKEVGHINREVRNVMVSVYSLNSNSWKLVEHTSPQIGSHVRLSQNGALVNNHLLHWLCSHTFRNEHQIACFDVGNDQWREVPLPEFTRSAELVYSDLPFKQMNLGVLDGSLCLMASNNVWIMKEYGVAESWVKLFNLLDMRVIGSLKSTPPVAYLRESCEILLRRDLVPQAFWYDFT